MTGGDGITNCIDWITRLLQALLSAIN